MDYPDCSYEWVETVRRFHDTFNNELRAVRRLYNPNYIIACSVDSERVSKTLPMVAIEPKIDEKLRFVFAVRVFG